MIKAVLMRGLMHSAARDTIVELCQRFYDLGWVSGTGGGICLRCENDAGDTEYVIAPSGVQKERMGPDDMFVLDASGDVIQSPSNPSLKVSACAPLFMAAFNLRGAGAVIHSHSIWAMLATLMSDTHFRVTHLEMMKGIAGVGYHDLLEVPVIENTAHECDLADSLSAAIRANPDSHAVLVRRHGVYIWGRDWVHAKTQAECYDYLFRAAVEMRRLGVNVGNTPQRS